MDSRRSNGATMHVRGARRGKAGREIRRALVIGAHPDDNEAGCGGTIARMVQEGWDVTYIVCTNGNKGSHDPQMSSHQLSARREEEQQAAASLLGVQQVIFLRHEDGTLQPSPELRAEMALYIRHFRPHAIFTHDPWQRYMLHPDHRAVGFAVLDGIVNARDHLFMPGLSQIGIPAWRPDVVYLWCADQPDHTEDISATCALKLAALDAHRSQQHSLGPFVVALEQQMQVWGQAAGFMYGEAFKKIPLNEEESAAYLIIEKKDAVPSLVWR